MSFKSPLRMFPAIRMSREAAMGNIPADALWWDPNGEGLPVVGAYRAIATAGSPWPLAPTVYADTLQNWSNPGTNDLAEGAGAVPWAAATGWQFNLAANQYFDTSIVPLATTWTMLVQYTGAVLNAADYIAGCFAAAPIRRFNLAPNWPPNDVLYANGTLVLSAPALPAGNIGVGGLNGYRDGIFDMVIPAGGIPPFSIHIGALNNAGVAANFITANIESIAIYSSTLAAPQMLAVATAMAAL